MLGLRVEPSRDLGLEFGDADELEDASGSGEDAGLVLREPLSVASVAVLSAAFAVFVVAFSFSRGVSSIAAFVLLKDEPIFTAARYAPYGNVRFALQAVKASKRCLFFSSLDSMGKYKNALWALNGPSIH